MLKDKHFNQTAYRLLLLLQWLWESPLSVDEINARLLASEHIGRTLSQDSLGLHINTLKALGCQISRPSKTNQYRYHLTYFPFNSFLTSQDLRTLEEAYEKAQNHLNYREFIYFHQFLKKLFHHAANTERHNLQKQFFEALRSQPLEGVIPLVDELEPFCQKQIPLSVRYQSPTKGLSLIPFLPQHLMHQQGTLYLVGYRQGRNTQSMLRLDRIDGVTPQALDNGEVTSEKPSQEPNRYEIRILHCTPEQYEPLGQNDEVVPDDENPTHLRVSLTTDNEFLLKQKLLSTHYDFQVLAPASFSRMLQETLHEMRLLYR